MNMKTEFRKNYHTYIPYLQSAWEPRTGLISPSLEGEEQGRGVTRDSWGFRCFPLNRITVIKIHWKLIKDSNKLKKMYSININETNYKLMIRILSSQVLNHLIKTSLRRSWVTGLEWRNALIKYLSYSKDLRFSDCIYFRDISAALQV